MPDALLLNLEPQSGLLLRRGAGHQVGVEAGGEGIPGGDGQLSRLAMIMKRAAPLTVLGQEQAKTRSAPLPYLGAGERNPRRPRGILQERLSYWLRSLCHA